MISFRKALISALSAGTLVVASAAVLAPAAPAPAATVRPAIDQGPCNSGTVNWAALYPTFTDWFGGVNASECFGFAGTTTSIPYNMTQVFCAGNNNGTFWWTDEQTNQTGSFKFTHDNSYSIVDGNVGAAGMGDFFDVTKVQITGFTGSAGC
jgi:hypothetical protein